MAILADTHGYLDPRIAAEVQGCEVAVHAGDVGSSAVLDALAPRSGRVVAVRGNNDTPAKWPGADASRLEALPLEMVLPLPGGELVVVHGDRLGPPARRHERLRRAYPWARAIVYGHSHRLLCDCVEAPWVINPGAAGRARTYGGPSCVLLTADPGGWGLVSRRFAPTARRRPLR